MWFEYVWNDIESFSSHCFLETTALQSRPYLEWKPTTVIEEEMVPQRNRKVKFYFSLATKKPFLLSKLPLAVHDENLREFSGSCGCGEGGLLLTNDASWIGLQCKLASGYIYCSLWHLSSILPEEERHTELWQKKRGIRIPRRFRPPWEWALWGKSVGLAPGCLPMLKTQLPFTIL